LPAINFNLCRLVWIILPLCEIWQFHAQFKIQRQTHNCCFLFSFSSIPLMYPASFSFNIPSSAFVTLSCTNLFIGVITTVTTFVLENFEDEELQYVGSILKEVFLIFPQYCLGRGLMDMATEMNINLIVAKFGLISQRNRYNWDFLGQYMAAMVFQGFFFYFVTLCIEFRVWTKVPDCLTGSYQTDTGSEPDEGEDEDVARERERVMLKNNPNDVLAVRGLNKKYSKNSKLAVDRLTFGVKKGECFGLLGVNGAGKTTTFKMLTGDTKATAGDALINGNSVLQELQKVRRSLGYCPQFDALNPMLTGREHLRLYARLRGLDENSVAKVSLCWLSLLVTNVLPIPTTITRGKIVPLGAFKKER
jgi:ABC-type multidrug transport system fused ATPase/permease subunit